VFVFDGVVIAGLFSWQRRLAMVAVVNCCQRAPSIIAQLYIDKKSGRYGPKQCNWSRRGMPVLHL
jgi:hypothetical protein